MPDDIVFRLIPVIVVMLAAQIILIVFGLKDILKREPDQIRGNKIIWIILIVCLSGGLGAVLYFAFGRRERLG